MEPTIRIQSRLGKRRLRKRADAEAARDGDADPTPEPTFSDILARRLALAHYIERLIDTGKLRNYAQAAAVLGITRARMSQLMDLALLPADMQQELLLGSERCSERDLRNKNSGTALTGRARPEPNRDSVTQPRTSTHQSMRRGPSSD